MPSRELDLGIKHECKHKQERLLKWWVAVLLRYWGLVNVCYTENSSTTTAPITSVPFSELFWKATLDEGHNMRLPFMQYQRINVIVPSVPELYQHLCHNLTFGPTIESLDVAMWVTPFFSLAAFLGGLFG